MKNILTNTNNSAYRLAKIVSYLKVSYNKLSQEIGLEKNTKIYHVKNGRNEISSDLAKTITERYPEISYDWLYSGVGEMFDNSVEEDPKPDEIPQGELKPKIYNGQLRVRLVKNSAKAGWSDGYYADEYLKEMPFVVIDADENHKGEYLAFEVDGDSMEPDYIEGNIVICREVQRHLWQSKLHFKDWDFVIAHAKKGIFLKEIVAHDVEKGIITCRSLNPNYKDFKIDLREVAHLYNVVETRQQGRRKRWNRAKDFFENE